MGKHRMTVWGVAVFIIIITMLFLTGPTIPDETFVRQQLEKNRSDIDIITGYLINSEYTNVYIQNATGIIVADLENVHITDSAVNDAISHVLNDYILINKVGNTIYLLQWRSTQDVGCGIAYAINGNTEPNVEFTTKLLPISDDGWFYYVSDYNKWRSEAEH